MANISRRGALIASGSLLAFSAPLLARAQGASNWGPPRLYVVPVPLGDVRLLPSIWLDAVTANVAYLKSLSVERLLHNFYRAAGLPTKGDRYGGWENLGIAGHSFGHYISACALAYAQTGDTALLAILNHGIDEADKIQDAHGDGYFCGTTIERDGIELDGKIIFEEVRHGDIRSNGFDLNGGWVPIYTYHKIMAGMIEAHAQTGNEKAKKIAIGMGDYLVSILADKSDDQIQIMLRAEHGGINETLTQTHLLSGKPSHLFLAQRLYHHEILDPLAQGQDRLSGKHANTQIPKLIGLARLYEVTGQQHYRRAASYFHDRVAHHHNFVIGGNSTGEHFGDPDHQADRIDDRTCEACNSYNMLKLTRHLYQWEPSAHWFDFYERTHLNHIIAHQNPADGAFVYFMPLSANSQRQYSTPTNSFWCCVGTGMESHAKHGDSIFWQSTARLYVNLYIPAALNWRQENASIELKGDITKAEPMEISVAVARPRSFELALRVPVWAKNFSLMVNGRAAQSRIENGYAMVSRRWANGDKLTISFDQDWAIEPVAGNDKIIAFTHGPLVMAADMGPAEGPALAPPALLNDAPLSLLNKDSRTLAAAHGGLPMVPFFSQYNRRTTTYFPIYEPGQFQAIEAAEQAQLARLEQERAATIDMVQLGEMQPERDHFFTTQMAEPTSRMGRAGRWIMWTRDKDFAFDLAVDESAKHLRVDYWGGDTYKHFDIFVNDQKLASETLAFEAVDGFRSIDYPLPVALIAGQAKLHVRFITRGSDLAVFGARTMRG